MSDAKIEKLEDYLLKLTEDIATVKIKLEVIDEIKDTLDDMHALKSEIDIMKIHVASIEKRIDKLETSKQEESKFKMRSAINTVLTIIGTVLSAVILNYFMGV